MKELAFGWMNCDPDVFYRMRLKDFLLKSKGFWERLKYDQYMMRRLAYITHASFVSKPLSAERLWPIDTEYKKVTQEDLDKRSADIMKRIQLMQAIEDEKAKRN